MILALFAAAVAGPPDPQTVRVEVLTEPRSWSPELTLVLHRAGGDEQLALAPVEGRQGVLAASSVGDEARVLDLEIDDAGRAIWRRATTLDAEEATISLLYDQASGEVTRVAWVPWDGAGASAGDTVSLAVAFGWGAACFGYVAWLARGRR